MGELCCQGSGREGCRAARKGQRSDSHGESQGIQRHYRARRRARAEVLDASSEATTKIHVVWVRTP
eukprot:7538816-Lingulodinium_polyedra.AAC.1